MTIVKIKNNTYMKLYKPSFNIWEQSAGLEGIYKQIERTGRVCYKSEDKIMENSAKPFVDRMIRSQHYAMLEHGTIYLHLTMSSKQQYSKYCNNPYSKANSTGEFEKGTWNGFVTTNYRVLVENNWLKDLQYLCEPTKYHDKRITVHFVCDRAVANEFVRHRVFSFAQESTRFCNYSKNKFDNELTFIIPCWLNIKERENYHHYGDQIEDAALDEFLCALQNAEISYLNMIACGWKPQEARVVLPLSLKTELIMTGFVSDWKHFFDLRALGLTGAPHPQAKELADPLMDEFIAKNYIIN